MAGIARAPKAAVSRGPKRVWINSPAAASSKRWCSNCGFRSRTPSIQPATSGGGWGASQYWKSFIRLSYSALWDALSPLEPDQLIDHRLAETLAGDKIADHPQL